MSFSTSSAIASATFTATLSLSAFSQTYGTAPNFEDEAACAACGSLVGAIFLIPLIFLAVNIALLIWVAKDAKARGMTDSALWMILVLITSFFGLIIYIFSRPEGELVVCQNCHNNRLKASAKCPHCGNA